MHDKIHELREVPSPASKAQAAGAAFERQVIEIAQRYGWRVASCSCTATRTSPTGAFEPMDWEDAHDLA